ncbi:MAG: phosphopantothenoylcysteine decarboxylase, partial [Erysipelotrichales bacterium]|nr:phosphopantothenoylcysteine decarboxylase [Erysipelotrichales bacterium]
MEKKFIVVGVSGGIAAFKACQLVSDLSKKYDVQVIMTKNACNFVNPITFETLTKKKCLVDTFDRNFEFKVEHVSVAKACDVFVVVPASANVIAKFANGIADDMLSTTMLACNKPRIICPAM